MIFFTFIICLFFVCSLLFFSLLIYCCAQVLSCILDPLLQLCTVSASNLGTADMATYMVNSLYMMKTTLALFEFTDKRLEMLEFQVCCLYYIFKASEFFIQRYIHQAVTLQPQCKYEYISKRVWIQLMKYWRMHVNMWNYLFFVVLIRLRLIWTLWLMSRRRTYWREQDSVMSTTAYSSTALSR